MATADQGLGRTPPRYGTSGRARRPRPRRLLHLLVVAAAAVAIGLVVWRVVSIRQNAEHAALLHMSPNDRRALYEQTRRSAAALCTEAATNDSLMDRCIGTARFLLAFPECDADCQAFARAHEHEATR